MHMVWMSFWEFFGDRLILNRNICAIKHLAHILPSLTTLHSQNVLKGGIYLWKPIFQVNWNTDSDLMIADSLKISYM